MKKNDSTKLLVVAFLICVCTLYTSLSHASGTLTDDFTGTSINTQLWEQWNTDQNQWCIQDDQLKIGINGASTGPLFGAGVYSTFELKGNFEIMVDYSLSTWPDSNGVRTGIRYHGETPSQGMIMRISPNKSDTTNPQGYYSTNFIDGGYNNVSMSSTIATSGSYKLTRVGDVMAGYYLEGGNWVPRGSHDYSVSGALPDWLGMDLSAWSHTVLQQPDGTYVYPFGGSDVQVAFDNLVINYDQIRYNDVPLPGGLLLLGSGLLGLAGIGRRSKKG